MRAPKPYYEMAELAGVLRKSTEAARKQFQRAGVAKKMHGRWVVTGGRLLSDYPELFHALVNQTGQERTEADTLKG